MSKEYKEVNFEKFCPLCEFTKTKEYDEPCNTCLENGMNEETEKPTCWKEK